MSDKRRRSAGRGEISLTIHVVERYDQQLPRPI